MDRRTFLSSSLVATAGTGLAAPAIAQEVRVLTMVTTWERGANGVHACAERVAASIAELSGGSLRVDLKAAGELVGAFDVFDAVTLGQVDMYHGPDYWFTGQHPAYAFFSTVPFGMTAQEMATWYYQDGGRDMHDRLGEVFRLKSFLAGTTGPQSGGWYRRAIREVDDLRGLRIRMPGLGGDVMAELGAEVITLPGAAVRPALANGELDATEWVGPWADELADFRQLIPYYYPAGFHEPGVGLSLAVNRDVFAALGPAHQRIIEIASAEAYQWSMTLFASKNGAALARLRADGVVTYDFPEPVWDAFGQAAHSVNAAHMNDSLYAEVFESYQRSMRSTAGWLGASEGAYQIHRARMLG